MKFRMLRLTQARYWAASSSGSSPSHVVDGEGAHQRLQGIVHVLVDVRVGIHVLHVEADAQRGGDLRDHLQLHGAGVIQEGVRRKNGAQTAGGIQLPGALDEIQPEQVGGLVVDRAREIGRYQDLVDSPGGQLAEEDLVGHGFRGRNGNQHPQSPHLRGADGGLDGLGGGPVREGDPGQLADRGGLINQAPVAAGEGIQHRIVGNGGGLKRGVQLPGFLILQGIDPAGPYVRRASGGIVRILPLLLRGPSRAGGVGGTLPGLFRLAQEVMPDENGGEKDERRSDQDEKDPRQNVPRPG